jgi:hypothetical protein
MTMKNWFESKVTYEKTLGNGMQKKVTESYLLDAISWTEAEARTIEELTQQIGVSFIITDIKRYKLSELFFSETGDRFFKAKIHFISLDEKNGTKEKISACYMLAQASDIDEAQEVIKKNMQGTISDYVIAEIKETKIMDVFPYKDNEDEESDS